MKYEQLKNSDSKRFKTAIGVTKETFETMVAILKKAYEVRNPTEFGRPKKLCIEDMLLATLEYLYENRTYECIGMSYGMSKSNIYKTIRWVEGTLIKSGLFNLPGKKVLANPAYQIEVILVDTTETPIQRPEKGQKRYYSGKKNDIH